MIGSQFHPRSASRMEGRDECIARCELLNCAKHVEICEACKRRESSVSCRGGEEWAHAGESAEAAQQRTPSFLTHHHHPTTFGNSGQQQRLVAHPITRIHAAPFGILRAHAQLSATRAPRVGGAPQQHASSATLPSLQSTNPPYPTYHLLTSSITQHRLTSIQQ